MKRRLLALTALAALAGCIEPIVVEQEPEDEPDLGPGDSRTIELRFLRLDVDGFETQLTLEQLRSLPQETLDEIWLLDLELTPLVTNALTGLRDLDEAEAAELPQAAQNMRRLLRTTPDNIDLDGTNLEELIALSAAVGVPPARALADVLDIGITDPVLRIDSAAGAVVDGLIGSHPGTQFRDGPVDDEHPDGKWPVAENSLPITLGDVVWNFEELPARFGPVETEFGMHPGFIEEANGFSVIEDEFLMSAKVKGNALPFKGPDLTDVSLASVSSVPSQIETLFATDEEDWLTVEGMVDEPAITSMTVNMVESDQFVSGGDSPDPEPVGNSEAWDLAPWMFERLVIDMAMRGAADVEAHCTAYELGTGAEAFESCVDETGWITFETFNDVGNPPPPSYLWDSEVEFAQVRLHDGGLEEGEADVQFSLAEVGIGVTSDELVEEIKKNLAENPKALQELAELITDQTDGAADFFYYRPKPGDEHEGDWLYFVAEDDMGLGEDGEPLRPYDYANPGFFADADLEDKVSEVVDVEGDTLHDKVQVEPGDTLYVQDDAGQVFRIDVNEKPSTFKVSLDVTRVD